MYTSTLLKITFLKRKPSPLKKGVSERSESRARHLLQHKNPLVKRFDACLDEVKSSYSHEPPIKIKEVLCNKRFYLQNLRDYVETVKDSQYITRATVRAFTGNRSVATVK